MRQISNPPNPYLKYSVEILGEPQKAKLEVFEQYTTKKIITKAYSSDFGDRFTVNCYRGCMHGCTYCFARQYHEYIDFGCGSDFESKIIVKPNAPKLLRNELKKLKWNMPHLDFSFATDPYLPWEANYELTRQCLEVCADFQIAVGVITKSPLVTRDIDILTRLKDVSVFFSIPFLTKEKSNPFEPFVPVPEVRFRAMKQLSDAGIPVGIGIAPIIPGYNESDIPGLLERAKECGAQYAFMSLLHFDTESILDYFLQKLEEKVSPTKVTKILNHIRRERGGELRHKKYAERGIGKTEQWEITKRLFEFHYKRLGFAKRSVTEMIDISPSPRVEPENVQPKLF
jgi:DNA repair photolyase